MPDLIMCPLPDRTLVDFESQVATASAVAAIPSLNQKR